MNSSFSSLDHKPAHTPGAAALADPTPRFTRIITGVEAGANSIQVRWADGFRSRYSLLWLRDNCPAIRHPGTGQRLVDITALPLKPALCQTRLESDDSLILHWTNDHHVSRFPGTWLREHAYDPADSTGKSTVSERGPRGIETWDAELNARLPEGRYPQIASSPEELRDWLRNVRRFGFALLRDVPRTPGFVLKVAALFGYIRETNYGRLMDIQCQGEPTNLVFSNAALAPHTDNPYRDPAPTLKLLHCLKNNADGGASLLVDGLRVAEELRRTAPDLFSLLANVKITYRFRESETLLECERSVIDLDSDGAVRGVYFNHRAVAPFRLPSGIMDAYYSAYHTFAKMLQSPRNQISFQLEPGDLYIVDNRRVLHGRTIYRNPFDRHLQACYADRDGLYSRLSVLESRLQESRFQGNHSSE